MLQQTKNAWCPVRLILSSHSGPFGLVWVPGLHWRRLGKTKKVSKFFGTTFRTGH